MFGYKRYSDRFGNRLVLMIKKWYNNQLSVDLFMNDAYSGSYTIKESWDELFCSKKADSKVLEKIKAEIKLDVDNMILFEEDLIFMDCANNLQIKALISSTKWCTVNIYSCAGNMKSLYRHYMFSVNSYSDLIGKIVNCMSNVK